MPALTATDSPPADRGPAWEIARLYPDQGQWGEGDYFVLNRQTNRLIELIDGFVEVLPLAGKSHQRIVLFFRDLLQEYAGAHQAGEALVAPYPIRIGQGKFRQPDVVFVRAEHASWLGEEFGESADLVVEVVSEDRSRDLVTKRQEYADAGIAEYWIVDPRDKRVTVLSLVDGHYRVHAAVGSGVVESQLLPGFRFSVEALFTSASRP